MLAKLLLIFTIVPLVELFLLIRVGEYLGAGPTVVIVAATGFFGVLLAKSQGLKVLKDMGNALTLGEMPGAELIDGVFILIGGAFLLTPGLLTDLAGFMLLFPGSRHIIKNYAKGKLQKMMESGSLFIYRR